MPSDLSSIVFTEPSIGAQKLGHPVPMVDCPTQDSASLWLRLSGWAGPIRSDAALQRLREIMGKLKLTVNEEKTRICKVPEGEFDFLGYTFGRMFSARTGQARIGYRPSRKSIQRVVEKVHALTDRSGTWQETSTLVSKVNRTRALGGSNAEK